MKKGQEEVVGFIVVVVLVVVVFLIFMSLNLRKPEVALDSVELSQFVQASFEYDTNCELNYELDYANVGDLLDACHQQKVCLNGETACNVLNNTLNSMIIEGLRIGADRPKSAYTFKAIFAKIGDLSADSERIISLSYGDCKSGRKTGTVKILPATEGTIKSSLEVCN